jgi:hypothetical protein
MILIPFYFWGAGKTCSSYIEALRAADNHDMMPLLVFARS